MLWLKQGVVGSWTTWFLDFNKHGAWNKRGGARFRLFLINVVAEITELWVENSQKINCHDVASIREGRVTFSLSKTLLFFFKTKIYYIIRDIFFKSLIVLAFFLPRKILKNILYMFRQKPRMLHWQNLLTESLKMLMWLIVRSFFVSYKHGQTSNVLWLSTTWLLTFRQEVENKGKYLYSQSC